MSRKTAILTIRETLLRRHEALRRALDGELSLLKELRIKPSGDEVDVASRPVQDEIASQLAEVKSRELKNINDALIRMDEKKYGFCDGCGHQIPMVRLNALPCATHCVECQRELERRDAEPYQEEDESSLNDDEVQLPSDNEEIQSWLSPDDIDKPADSLLDFDLDNILDRGEPLP